MVVVNPKSSANLKPNPKPDPKSDPNPYAGIYTPSYNPIEKIVSDRNESAQIAKNKDLIRAKYYQLTQKR